MSAFIEPQPFAPVLTDACAAAGGAFFNGDFMYVRWDSDVSSVQDCPINYKEAMIAAISISRWQAHFKNKTIAVYTDNICAASIINKCSSKNSAVMHALRDMFWAAATHNFVVRALYMPGHRHVIADCISRLHEPIVLNRSLTSGTCIMTIRIKCLINNGELNTVC